MVSRLKAAPTKLGAKPKKVALRRAPSGASSPSAPIVVWPESLRQLGKQVKQPSSPAAALLETIAFLPAKNARLVVRFTCPEFTALCPVTGQPDFAIIVIDFVPRARLIESKSLKLFITSFRNTEAFHEKAVAMIGERLADVLDPIWLRVGGYFAPRGGIPIDVFFSAGKLPDGVWAPEQQVAAYRGR